MTLPAAAAPPDLTGTVLRALLLYALAEHQSGSASTIRVTAAGSDFAIADDGRGHPLDKTLDGNPYLDFVYTHFDYPFHPGQSAPVQLQGIGLSMVNALCSELRVRVYRGDAELELRFVQGRRVHQARRSAAPGQRGVHLSGRIAPALGSGPVDTAGLEQWLLGVLGTAPGLSLWFNGRRLQAAPQGTGAEGAQPL